MNQEEKRRNRPIEHGDGLERSPTANSDSRCYRASHFAARLRSGTRHSLILVMGLLGFLAATSSAQTVRAEKGPSPTAAPAEIPVDLIWQLGVPDGQSAEFLPFKTGHFCHNWDMVARPGWNATENSFHFIVTKSGVDPKPLYPAGISGPTGGTRTWCQRETIAWTDDGQGWRMLEIPLLDSHNFNFKNRHHAIDPDTNDWARYSLRTTLPDGQVVHTYLPYNLPAYEAENGQIVVRTGFKAQAGENRLELLETSGSSSFRNYHFDYIRIARTDLPPANPPTVEIETAEGFSHHTIYDWKKPAQLKVQVYNLHPGDVATLRMGFRDFFGRIVAQDEQPVLADVSGRASATFACPDGITGHLRATAELCRDGQPLSLQMGGKQVMRRLCAVRTIAPLNDEEIERSFIGLCGLSRSGTFDVYTFRQDCDRKDEIYRQFRRTLQIHNERYHSLSWPHLELKENEFRWEYWDKVFAKEKEERIRLQLGVMGTPEWLLYKFHPERRELRDIHKKFNSCPPDMEKWGDVCAKIAERYRDKIADFEVWNEPSEYSLYWYKASAEDYFNLIKYAALGVRRVAPQITIVAETVWARQPEFYQKLYQMGVAQYVDYPADHYMNDSRIRLVKRFLDQVNGFGKGLINNEDYAASCGRQGEIDEDARVAAARKLSRGIIHANACGIKRIYEFQLVSPSWKSWGFLSPIQEPRYSFASFKTLVNRTTGAEFRKGLDLGDKLEGYVYHYFDARRVEENGGDTALFLFNLDSAARPLRLYVNRPQVTVVDLMDNAREVRTTDGLFVWELGADPIIVIGADPAALEKQDALCIEPVAPSAKPGQALRVELSLVPGQTGSAEVRLDAGELAAAPVTATLSAGRTTLVEVPLRADQPEGVYPLEIAARIPAANGVIPVYRRVAATVAKLGLGENHFAADTFSTQAGEWKGWGGDGRTSSIPNAPGRSAARVDLEKTDGVDGWRTARLVTVIPGARYHIMFRARGKGLLRLLQKKHLDNGRIETVHNLHNGKLGPDWSLYDRDWTAPLDVRSIEFSLYLWHDVGWFEVTDFRFLRIPADQPVNRLLYTAVAKPAEEIKLDGRLDEWPDRDFIAVDPNLGIRMDGYGGPEDIAAKFAAQWRDQTLYFAVVVTDDKMAEGPDACHVYKGDSVQLDFEIDNRNAKSPTAQLSLGLIGDNAAIFRHRTIPTEDIVPSYVTGPDPEGVSAVIRREGNRTYYEIAVEGRALCPTFRLEKGRTIAFSFLVNDNDGAGRKGWLEWSSGIGALGGSVLFGSLTFE